MDKSFIQWTTSTVNFWMGCHKVSAGCKYCYMYRIVEGKSGNASKVWRTSDAKFYSALRWKDPRMIFTCSMSDFFLEEADEWREDAWDIIRNTPHHTWQILTKRPERVIQCLPPDWGEGWENVHLGVSVENQVAMHRAACLAEIPAYVRFVSAEPLLEQVDLLQVINGKRIIDKFHWVILGGESGNETGKYLYRPCELEWLKNMINDLKENTNVAVFNKQLGSHLAKTLKLKHSHGGDINEWPKELRVREFPVVGVEFAMA